VVVSNTVEGDTEKDGREAGVLISVDVVADDVVDWVEVEAETSGEVESWELVSVSL